VRSQRGLRERFRRGLEVSGRYDATFRRIFREAGLPEDLAYLPHVESSFQASARSSAGAEGLWQFTRGTGKRFLKINAVVDERLDPVAAAYGAAQYFKQAYEKLGNWPLAVTSYNHGVGGMEAAKEQFGTDFARIVSSYQGRAFGFASRNFYAEFLAVRDICRHTNLYFPHGVRFESPLTRNPLVLIQPMPAQHIAKHYGFKLRQLCDANPAWSARARQGRLHIPKGTRVWLPSGKTPALAKTPWVFKPIAKGSSVSKRIARAGINRPHRVHVVKRNETLYELATRYRLTVASLKRLNGISHNDNLIHPGQRLRIPAGPSHAS
jgi:membrane-bound lytic murein transglycosylase D